METISQTPAGQAGRAVVVITLAGLEFRAKEMLAA
jgi:hypothetical protein